MTLVDDVVDGWKDLVFGLKRSRAHLTMDGKKPRPISIEELADHAERIGTERVTLMMDYMDLSKPGDKPSPKLNPFFYLLGGQSYSHVHTCDLLPPAEEAIKMYAEEAREEFTGRGMVFEESTGTFGPNIERARRAQKRYEEENTVVIYDIQNGRRRSI